MTEDKLLMPERRGRYSITNLGAICFARKLSDFPSLAGKAFRLVKYVGADRSVVEKEFFLDQGYVVDFDGVVRLIRALLPSREKIGGAYRREDVVCPEGMVRELVLNAFAHRDFRISGAGPALEIFQNRMEISNPGLPTVEISRMIDSPPQSLNEGLASFMRRMHRSKESEGGTGSGMAEVVAAAEAALCRHWNSE